MRLTEAHVRAVEKSIEMYTPPFTDEKMRRWRGITPECLITRRKERYDCPDCLYAELGRRGLLEFLEAPLVVPCSKIKGAPPVPHFCVWDKDLSRVPLCGMTEWDEVLNYAENFRRAKRRSEWLGDIILPLVKKEVWKDIPRYKIGDRFVKEGVIYMLAWVTDYSVALVSMDDGNRWCNAVQVDIQDNRISHRDFIKVCGGKAHEFCPWTRKVGK